jgi:hypothetical protein
MVKTQKLKRDVKKILPFKNVETSVPYNGVIIPIRRSLNQNK